MNDKSYNISTRELWAKLFKASSVSQFFGENDGLCELPAFSDYISELCRLRGEKPGSVIKRSQIDSSYGHRLFSGLRNPSRDTVIQLAFGFGMDLEETQQLLKIAHAALLHPKVKRDAIIVFCICHGISLMDTQLTLENNSLPLIGGIKHVR
ncbi:MAG: hypothetical protein IJI25_02875 [Eubacterium sp.]|nr:hypothetical protein [Eubacterium sp.]